MSAALASREPVARPAGGFTGTPFPPHDREGADRGALAGIRAASDLSACLLPMLEALGWQGHPQEVAEALPHFTDSLDITAFRNVIAALGYHSYGEEGDLDDIEPDMAPCLFVPNDGSAMVLVSGDGKTLQAFDGAHGRYGELPDGDMAGTAYTFTPLADVSPPLEQQGIDWFRTVGTRFKGLFRQALGITLLMTFLNLATPLFVFAIYDRVVAAGSLSSLAYLAVGVGIAVACDWVLWSIRSRIFSFVGARLDNIVGIEAFRKTLSLPLALIERTTVGAHVSRIRDFETAREFLTGPAAPALFELPMALVFVVAIAYLGGWIAVAPIVAIALAAALALSVRAMVGRRAARAAGAAAELQQLTVETLAGMRAIKYCGAEATWLARYRKLSAEAALHEFHSSQFSSLVAAVSAVALVGGGLATAIFGAYRVQTGEMTLGALAACLIMAWRAMIPMQAAIGSLGRFTQVETGVVRLNELMAVKSARESGPPAHVLTPLKGRVGFASVTLRYDPELPPALNDISFDMKKGRVVAVLGGNGAGKSTLIKLLAGMYRPDQGSILIDERNVLGIPVHELRQAIAYVPQTPQFFYGTIAQNLRLAHPTASDDDLRRAARQAGALEDIEALEQGSGEWKRTGFDVRLGDSGAGQVSPGLLQRLNLARGYLKRAPILLLDEPGSGLDMKGDQALMRALANLRAQTTVFIVTHRPSHLKMADRIIWLEKGKVRSVGRPKVVMPSTGGIP
jgi:ATP-binding cassette subfamily C protein/ATP-binding cassette subfamily C protein LapB